jgi:hypothetical protein
VDGLAVKCALQGGREEKNKKKACTYAALRIYFEFQCRANQSRCQSLKRAGSARRRGRRNCLPSAVVSSPGTLSWRGGRKSEQATRHGLERRKAANPRAPDVDPERPAMSY